MRSLFLARDIFNGSEKSEGFSTAVRWIKDLTFSEKTLFLILKWNAILRSERYAFAIKSGRHGGADSACASCVWWKIRAGHSSIWNSWKLIETFTEITQNTEITWKNETQNKISFLPLVLPFARRQNLYSVWNLYESNVLKMVCESQCEFGMWNGRKPECQNLNHSRKRKAWKKVPSERLAE